ncbi:UNVERIFIED_CONTAM: hypothetical protein NCL1_22041 [Trichonephila clavipes]
MLLSRRRDLEENWLKDAAPPLATPKLSCPSANTSPKTTDLL